MARRTNPRPRWRASFRHTLETLESRILLAVCDFDASETVDRGDAAILVANYGRRNAEFAQGDCDGNGVVDLHDVAELQIGLGSRAAVDFGDAPTSYRTLLANDGARHRVKQGFQLGLRIDADADGQPTAGASGDDGDADGDDEDGVRFVTVPVAGMSGRLEVDASAAGRLDAFMDFNRNGSFEATEQVFAGEPLAAGTNFLGYPVPANALTSSTEPTIARFRFSSAGGLGAFGPADDGEVEDYRMYVYGQTPQPTITTQPWEWNFSLTPVDGEGQVSGKPVDFSVSGDVTIHHSPPVVLDSGQTFDLADPRQMPVGEQATWDTEILSMDLRGGNSLFLPEVNDEVLVQFERGDLNTPVVVGRMWATRIPSAVNEDVVVGRNEWQLTAEFTANHPDFAWVPTFNPTPAEVGMDFGPNDTLALDEIITLPLFFWHDEVKLPLLSVRSPDLPLWRWNSVHARPVVSLDWGDAPDPTYPTLAASNGARHRIRQGMFLGAGVERDANGQPHPAALGDDVTDGTDDEDGVTAVGATVVGSLATVEVVASTDGFLNAWMDFDRDGAWSAAEQIFAAQPLVPGVNTLTFGVPASAIGDAERPTFSRWRFGTQANLPPTGFARDGEVEDHAWLMRPRSTALQDFGDAPDPRYPTLTASGGASHVIVPGFHLGESVDGEPDGQPDAAASKDDTIGIADDEDGVAFLTPLVPGTRADVLVTASADGLLNAFFDWNQNGIWDAGVDHAFVDRPLAGGPNLLSLSVPVDAVGGRTYARFRFNRDGGLGPGGPADDGEVEDYVARIEPAPPGRTVLQTNQSDLDFLRGRVAFAPPTLVEVEGDGKSWTQVLVPGVESILGSPGLPAIPVFQRLVAIPMGSQVTILPFIEQDNLFKLADVDLLPYQPTALDGDPGQGNDGGSVPPLEFFGDPDEFAFDAATYAEDAPFPREFARFVPLGKMRDLDVGLIQIAAGQYNPATRELTLFRDVDFEVQFEGGMRGFLPAEANNPFENVRAQYAGVLNAEAVFEHVLPGDFVINDCGFSHLGEELLILTHPDFRDAANALHDWKETKGIVTTVFEVGAGTARDTKEEIYDLIDHRFDECTIRPSYVLFLGDTEFIPTYYRSTLYAGGDGGPKVKKNQDTSSGQWVNLGRAYFNANGSEDVLLTRPNRDADDPDYGLTVADAVRFVHVDSAAEVIVDNLSGGFSTTGAWYESAATDEYANSSLFTSEIGATASFEPSSLPAEGLYDVYAWWSAETAGGSFYDRDSTATYTIRSSNTGTDTPYVYVADSFINILPDMANGRIPVDTLQQAMDVVDKIIRYEQDPPGSFANPQNSFYNTASLASQFQGYRSGDPTGRDQRGFIEVSEQGRNTLLAAGKTVERIYGKTEKDNPEQAPPNRYYDGSLLPSALRASSGFPWDGDTQDVIDAFNDGRFLITHRDHGGSGGWGTPGFSSTNVSNDLHNGELLPVVYSVNCASGIFDNETSGTLTGTSVSGSYFAERLIRLADGGAVGVIGDTRNSNTWSNNEFYRGLIDATWPSLDPGYGSNTSIRRLGDIMNYAKEYTISRIGVAGSLPAPSVDTAIDTLFLYHVFGDPTLEMWTTNPNPTFLPGDITLGPIVDPDIWDFTYGEGGDGDGATLTVFQEINGELSPLGRATVAGGVASIPLLVSGDPDRPFIVGACREDAVCVLPKLTANAAEVDSVYDVIGTFTIHLPTGEQEDVRVAGSMTVNVRFEGPNAGDAQDDDGDGLDEVPTEIVALDVQGTSASFGAVRARLSPNVAGRGEIRELANNVRGTLDVAPFVAQGAISASFDVFVEVEAANTVFHHNEPFRLTGEFSHMQFGPNDRLTQVGDPIELLDPQGNPTGTQAQASFTAFLLQPLSPPAALVARAVDKAIRDQVDGERIALEARRLRRMYAPRPSRRADAQDQSPGSSVDEVETHLTALRARRAFR